jgi:hypothetical protein
MFFDLSNYWIFVAFIGAIYVGISTFAQNNIGGKGRLRGLQAEIKEVQQRMAAHAKDKNDKEVNAAIEQNWKLAMEMMVIQLKLAVAILAVFFIATAFIFPNVEPGKEDDIKLQLFDDGLALHCDALTGDGIFSGCLALPQDAQKGAWAIDVFLRSDAGDTLAHNATPIFVEGGEGWQVLTQVQPAGLLDGLLGKVPKSIALDFAGQEFVRGQTVALRAAAYEQKGGKMQQMMELAGGKMEAVADSGTFFYYDPPIPIPLINVRRIIGSGGFFIFIAFVLSMCYSVLKAAYGKFAKKS